MPVLDLPACAFDRSGPMLRWPVAAAIGLGTLALILPNHAPPWMSFLQESFAASALALLVAGALGADRGRAPWRLPEAMALGLLLVVGLQFAAGLVESLQTAWMHALYLLGLVLALQTGATLERRWPGAALAAVVLPALLAGMVSVGLQGLQWRVLAPGEGTVWVYRSIDARHAANLGQPNLLATVLVLALLGLYALWRLRRWPGGWVIALSALPMAGLALTQSRTGLLNALLVAAALLAWHWPDRRLRRVLPMLALALLVLYAGYFFAQTLDAAGGADLASGRTTVGSRPAAWQRFAQAVFDRPWGGYGWGQTFSALLAVAPGRPPLGELFLSAHNLPLELALWSGLPIAALVCTAAASWFVICQRRAKDEIARLLLLAVAVVAVHAMLEYPLHYAYFLLPTGLAAGALGERLQLRAVWRAPRLLTLALLALALAAAGLTVRDYLRVEHSYRQLLLEKARIVVDDRSPPEVVVLSSLRDLIVFSRTEPSVGMTDADLQWMARVVRAHPGSHGFARLAQALALNGRPDEAQAWIDQLCRVFVLAQCRARAEEWAQHAGDMPLLRTVRWP